MKVGFIEGVLAQAHVSSDASTKEPSAQTFLYMCMYIYTYTRFVFHVYIHTHIYIYI